MKRHQFALKIIYPEFNPIEKMWGIIKNGMRRLYQDGIITAAEFRKRFEKSANQCTPLVWSRTIRHCREEMDIHIEEDNIIIDPSMVADVVIARVCCW
jgi:hypothetical protein